MQITAHLKLLLLTLLAALSLAANARRSGPALDTSLRLLHLLPVKTIRILPSGYDNADEPWSASGRTRYISSEQPLGSQIQALLSNNCSDSTAETISIALEEVKMYFANPSYLYFHAEFFSGQAGALHHFYSLDTIVQKAFPWLSRDGDQRIASECLIDATFDACRHLSAASAASLSDEDAVNYYRAVVNQYPLYTRPGIPPMGIYRTVDDFLALRAVDTPLLFEHIPQMNGDGYNWFYIKTAEGKKGSRIEAGDFYAASDGKSLFLSAHGTLYKIRKAHGDYFIIMTAKMLVGEGFNLSGALDKAVSKDGQGSRAWTEVAGKFSPERKRFLPYGHLLPRE